MLQRKFDGMSESDGLGQQGSGQEQENRQ
jgi:hypothetical protein